MLLLGQKILHLSQIHLVAIFPLYVAAIMDTGLSILQLLFNQTYFRGFDNDNSLKIKHFCEV